MNCEEALELLSGHIDESNTPEEEAQLQAHLKSCPACQAILAAYEALDGGLSSLKAEPPAALAQGVMDAIRREEASRKKVRRFPTRGIAATAVAAALLLVVGITYLPTLVSTEVTTAAVSDAASDSTDASSTAGASSDSISPVAKSIPMEEEAEDAAGTPDLASAEADDASTGTQSDLAPQADTVTTAVAPSDDGTSANAFSIAPADDTGSDAPTADTMTVTPSMMTADAPSDAVEEAFPDGEEVPQLLVELLDNPSAPAATNIVELAQLTAEATATDRIVFYECSAATVREIVTAYETVYEFETPALLDTAADSEICGLLVIQP